MIWRFVVIESEQWQKGNVPGIIETSFRMNEINVEYNYSIDIWRGPREEGEVEEKEEKEVFDI